MSYEPTTWVTGDIITATKLNNIESGVQSVSNSYTPTTWATGDIITATKLNNIEQGIANAGGGSSDFSTATVTVTTTAEESKIWVSNIEEAALPFIPDAHSRPNNNVNPNQPRTLNVVLYKGHATGFLEEGATATVTGSITRSGTTLRITGDGTIAISKSPAAAQ